MIKTKHLYDKQTAISFYQSRHSNGYMLEWPDEKKQRVHEVIQDLHLPASGDALDFGCGNGIFTSVLKRALPTDWKVYGTDISNVAIENARRRNSDCIFFRRMILTLRVGNSLFYLHIMCLSMYTTFIVF